MTGASDNKAPSSSTRSPFYIARQPIFDNSLKVFGYELIFRANRSEQKDSISQDQVVSRTINSILELGLDNLAGKARAFLKLAPNLLLNYIELPLESDRIAVTVPRDLDIDDKLVQSLELLATQGFTIVVDADAFESGSELLAGLTHIIKLDIRAVGRADLAEWVQRLHPQSARLLAENVDAQEDYEACRDAGFDYFHGHFLERPRMIEHHRLPENKVNVLRLLTALQNPDIEPKDVERIIKYDVTLNYMLLRSVNSAYFGLPMTVKTVSHAVAYLGLNAVRSLVRLILLADLDDRPDELTRIALTRARMAENLTANLSEDTRQDAFMVGLFSLLDAMLETPMANVVSQLPLVAEVRDALLKEAGPYGRMLRTIRAYEHGDWAGVESQQMWSEEDLASAYLEAVRWSNEQAVTLPPPA